MVLFRYDNPAKRLDLPDGCADLITMNQGLHHLDQNGLLGFLAEVKRLLRPGGECRCHRHRRPCAVLDAGLVLGSFAGGVG